MKKIILLAQELGEVKKDENGNAVCIDPENPSQKGRDSTAKIAKEIKEQNPDCEVVQFKILNCEIKNGILFYNNEEVDIDAFDAVISRSWDGGANFQKRVKIQEFVEDRGLFADTPSQNILPLLSKQSMIERYKEIDDLKSIELPKQFYGKDLVDENDIDRMLLGLVEKAVESEGKPLWVLKPIKGTSGKGIEFYGEENKGDLKQKLLANIKKTEGEKENFVIQQYIEPELFVASQEKKISAHYRVIISRDKEGEYNFIGGLKLQKDGSFISNTGSQDGRLLETPYLEQHDLSNELLEDLYKIVSHFGVNQAGFDLIKGKNRGWYFLELNESMGITGPKLESQGALKSYVTSFLERRELFLQNKIQKDAESALPGSSPQPSDNKLERKKTEQRGA